MITDNVFDVIFDDMVDKAQDLHQDYCDGSNPETEKNKFYYWTARVAWETARSIDKNVSEWTLWLEQQTDTDILQIFSLRPGLRDRLQIIMDVHDGRKIT